MIVNERILAQIKGVIHVGANIGQERDVYAKYDLNVLWFEPNPTAFRELAANIVAYPKHNARQLLLTDRDLEKYTLQVTNGYGQASSIFEMGKQIELYPDFVPVQKVDMESVTLDTYARHCNIWPRDFQFLVVDTQGADLLVLRGAVNTLKWLQFVEVETSPLEMYKNGCLEHEVIEFMESQNYKEVERTVVTPNIDNHILFENQYGHS